MAPAVSDLIFFRENPRNKFEKRAGPDRGVGVERAEVVRVVDLRGPAAARACSAVTHPAHAYRSAAQTTGSRLRTLAARPALSRAGPDRGGHLDAGGVEHGRDVPPQRGEARHAVARAVLPVEDVPSRGRARRAAASLSRAPLYLRMGKKSRLQKK
jgi:hypothetical protein